MTNRTIDLTGQKFGSLTVLEHAGRDCWRNSQWLVRCECNSSRTWVAIYVARKKSCGREGCPYIAHRIHGHTLQGKDSPEYSSWKSMKQRCINSNAPNYHYYGGRGISVCPQWMDSFESFLADMGPRPQGHSLDRINNDGIYEKANCRWAPPAEQRRNQRPRRQTMKHHQEITSNA